MNLYSCAQKDSNLYFNRYERHVLPLNYKRVFYFLNRAQIDLNFLATVASKIKKIINKNHAFLKKINFYFLIFCF